MKADGHGPDRVCHAQRRGSERASGASLTLLFELSPPSRGLCRKESEGMPVTVPNRLERGQSRYYRACPIMPAPVSRRAECRASAAYNLQGLPRSHTHFSQSFASGALPAHWQADIRHVR
uniref:Uncharacterized protein n=1 Tax=Mycena chlorophos TaxID=658473 RepID=A0ABQ0L9T9_MYCCL|nr:predicted protein [Mycena chlorophos]